MVNGASLHFNMFFINGQSKTNPNADMHKSTNIPSRVPAGLEVQQPIRIPPVCRLPLVLPHLLVDNPFIFLCSYCSMISRYFWNKPYTYTLCKLGLLPIPSLEYYKVCFQKHKYTLNYIIQEKVTLYNTRGNNTMLWKSFFYRIPKIQITKG